jgi:predicted transposase/invertase (TIGR01784 family)
MFFIKRAIFYLCSKVTDSVKKGKEGNDFNFPPIYSLNFLNFDLNFGRGCDNVVQYLSLSNEEQPSVRYDYMHLIFVMLPRFKKTLDECQTLQEKLLYCFRHIHKLKERPKQLREKLFKQLFEILEISRFSDVEYSEYMSRFMAKADRKAQMNYAKAVASKQGWRKGVKEGRKEGIVTTAKNMLKDGLDLARVARITKLPEKEILALR